MAKNAGVLLFLAGFVILMGIITAEIFYPGYNVSKDFISDLGSSRPPHSIIRQPSAHIFDISMAVAGAFVVLGSWFWYSVHGKKSAMIPMVLMGVGAIGVGIFPAYHAIAHPFSAGVAFFAGSIAAILCASLLKGPFRLVSFVLGLTSLIFLLLGLLAPQTIVPALGNGGTERLAAYPVIIWLIGLGGYLMGKNYSK